MTPKLEISEQQLRDELIALWKQDLGFLEPNGQNRGPLVDEINEKMGVPPGSSYCLSALLIRGLRELCLKYDLINPVPMMAGTQNFWETCVKLGQKHVIPCGFPATQGSICILQDLSDPIHGHAFGCTEYQTDIGVIKTVEYNTNTNGSSNGDGCYERVRSQSGDDKHLYLGAIDVIEWLLYRNSDKFL